MIFFDEKIRKLTSKTKYYLIDATIFFLLGILCFEWAYYINENTKDNHKTLHELISKGSKLEKEIVSLTITEKPYVFAEYDSNSTSDKYYFLPNRKVLLESIREQR